MTMGVTQERPNVFTIKLEHPEFDWLQDIARALGMTKSAVLSASVNQGLLHYFDMCKSLTLQDVKNSEKANNLDPGTS